MTLKHFVRKLEGYTAEVVRTQGIPALSIAIAIGDEFHRAAHGVLNTDTGVDATPDSIFQIGSISKVFTASLIMLLVDKGEIELDAPVKNYLPEFRVADPGASATLTVRQLLSHTSGLISDVSFAPDEFGGVASIARYVDRCFLAPAVHNNLGQRFSYSNAAYVIAGRLVEVILGVPWSQAIRELILEPLDLAHAVVDPRDVLRFRVAMGHLVSGTPSDGTVSVAPTCYFPMGLAPAASVLTMSASDLIKFGVAHLRGGLNDEGERWMSESSACAMREAQTSLPAPCLLGETQWGLGWALYDFGGLQAFGHAGGTVGQQALLQVFPEYGVTLGVLLNGVAFGGAPTLQRVLSDVICEISGSRLTVTKSNDQTVDAKRFTGRFGSSGLRLEFLEESGQFRARLQLDGDPGLALQTFVLKSINATSFAAYTLAGQRMDDFSFLEPDTEGLPKYVFYGYRLSSRI